MTVVNALKNLLHAVTANTSSTRRTGVASYRARAPALPSTSDNFILVHLNLTANYPSM